MLSETLHQDDEPVKTYGPTLEARRRISKPSFRVLSHYRILR